MSSSGDWKNSHAAARCITIRAHTYEDPESTFALGPVLETLRNVLHSVDCCEVDMKFGAETSDLANQ